MLYFKGLFFIILGLYSFKTSSQDITSPTMTILADEVNDGETSNHSTLSLTFTSSEETRVSHNDPSVYVSTSNDILKLRDDKWGLSASITHTLHNLSGTITINNVTYTITGLIATGTYIEYAVTPNPRTNGLTTNGYHNVITVYTGFDLNKITTSGGSLSNFSTTSSTVYTATFNPSGEGEKTIDVAAGAYTDMAGNDNVAAEQFNWTYDTQTASVEKHAKPITVYPNPTSATIEVQQEFSVAKVYDLSGKEMLKSNSKTIDLSELPSSVYLLRLYGNSNKVLGTTKVVKM